MTKATLCHAAMLIFVSAAIAQAEDAVDVSGVPQLHENPSQHGARMKWWRDAKFGLFLHWGPVSVSGRELSWGRHANRPWDVSGLQTPRTTDPEYDNLYKKFNPVKFDADQWVKIAQDAGMKYIVLICKHHDGFSMFDSKLTEYDIMATPYGKDIVKQLAAACHRSRMRLGLYYSTRDWYHPDYLVGDNKKYDAFYRGQVEELLGNYGKVDVMWFDHVGGRDWSKWKFDELFAMMYRHQPDLLVNDRVARFCGRAQPGDLLRPSAEIEKMTAGDFATPEETVGRIDLKHDWESCITLAGNQWSYKPGGKIRPVVDVVTILVSCVTGGGNLLLNVGPMPTGELDADQVKVLKAAGDWIKPRAEAIYGTRGGPLPNRRGGIGGLMGSTHRGNKVYLFLKTDIGFDPNHELVGKIEYEIPSLPAKVVAAKRLVGDRTVTFEATKQGTKLSWWEALSRRDPYYTIIAITLDKPIEDGTLLTSK